MATMGCAVTFRHVTCEISIGYLVERLCKCFELKRKD